MSKSSASFLAILCLYAIWLLTMNYPKLPAPRYHHFGAECDLGATWLGCVRTFYDTDDIPHRYWWDGQTWQRI